MKEKKYNLYWGGVGEGETLSCLSENLTYDELTDKIKEDLNKSVKSYSYIRTWEDKNQLVFDYGSYNNFYLAKEV